MGSIVGGAYATGLTASEMEKTLAAFSTRTLLEEKPPRQDQAIRRKLDDRALLFDVEAGLDTRGISLQKGAISGVGLEAVLRRLSLRPGYLDFDQLPIPYRAVATDLVTGKAVDLSEGELASRCAPACRCPGAIAPAEIGGQLLVDGGLTNNLPVRRRPREWARTSSSPSTSARRWRRARSITTCRRDVADDQHPDRAERSCVARVAEADDILIEPELGDFSASDFDTCEDGADRRGGGARRRRPPRGAGRQPGRPRRLRAGRTSPVDRHAPVDAIRFAEMKRVNPEVLRT
jgi:NTE family protein